jgi:hypothetical protein
MTESSANTLWRSVSKPIRKWREKRRFKRDSRKDVFRFIYETNKWGSEASRSGKGSDMVETADIRQNLPGALSQLSIQSILDLPCGDMHWMQTLDLSPYRYIGAAIVPDLIERNRQQHPQFTFDVLDICESQLPTVDLMLSRDLFVHLAFRDIELAVDNICKSDIRYLACTTFPSVSPNVDKLTGNHRKLNMAIAPINFGEPRLLLADGTKTDESGQPEKYLGIWEVADLARRPRA